jgi:predicted YcjX-like family ATPase
MPISLGHLLKAVPDGLNRTVNTDTIRLAVTGLSRAGKTVFITSLIANLLALAHGRRTLPQLSAGGIAERLSRIEIAPPKAEALSRFPYKPYVEALAAISPVWPDRTSDVSRISLSITARRKSELGKRLGDREVELQVLDYPGEWLLDLPLLGLTYLDWSRSTLQAMQSGYRKIAATDFIAALTSSDPNAPADDGIAWKLHELYRKFLDTCREKYRLRYLQPGRCLCPGPWGDVPLMWFAPLALTGPIHAGSLAALMEARYEAYKTDIRERFFDPYFSAFDRQIVLVDVLGALHAGAEAFRDTEAAINQVLDGFRYSGSRLSRIIGNKIDRVMIAATKADHVPQRQRESLEQLLISMVGNGVADMKRRKVTVQSAAIASVVCTQEDVHTIDGRAIQVVKGLPLGGNTVVKFWPGEVPVRSPENSFWDNSFFELPVFQAPKIDGSGLTGIPNIGLDQAASFLIGDAL